MCICILCRYNAHMSMMFLYPSIPMSGGSSESVGGQALDGLILFFPSDALRSTRRGVGDRQLILFNFECAMHFHLYVLGPEVSKTEA